MKTYRHDSYPGELASPGARFDQLLEAFLGLVVTAIAGGIAYLFLSHASGIHARTHFSTIGTKTVLMVGDGIPFENSTQLLAAEIGLLVAGLLVATLAIFVFCVTMSLAWKAVTGKYCY